MRIFLSTVYKFTNNKKIANSPLFFYFIFIYNTQKRISRNVLKRVLLWKQSEIYHPQFELGIPPVAVLGLIDEVEPVDTDPPERKHFN